MTAIPTEVLGLRVEVVRSIRRTAGLLILGTDLQVRVPEHVGDERVVAILKQKRPWIRSKVAELKRVPPHRTKELVSGIRWESVFRGDTSRQPSDPVSRVSIGP
jgi:predicted metal-dependent hydrolase